MKCFLRFDSDYLADAEPHRSLTAAKYKFLKVARELNGYGQKCEASIHIASDKDSLVEYPDYTLALGKNGGLQVQKA